MLRSLLLVVFLFHGVVCIQLVSIEVPKVAKKGSTVRLVCIYSLEREKREGLYTLKWLFSDKEFYRFSPRDGQQKRVFPFPGIDVDSEASEDGTVYLKDVTLSGRYKCEVSAEKSFETIFQEKRMTVNDAVSCTNPKTISHWLLIQSLLVFIYIFTANIVL